LAARGPGQELAERDDVGVSRFIDPFAALNEFGAEIRQMRDRSAEARQSEAQEHPEHFQKGTSSLRGRGPGFGAHKGSPLRRRGRELGNVSDSERLFDLCDLRHRVLEAVLAELLMLDFLEKVAHLVELAG